MAVSAKFVADFSNFLAAARAAEGSLDKLAAASGVTEASVDRVGKAFKGENIIANATKAVQAVEAIGGASNLTESEMERVNRTITAAIDKMTRLGVQIPPEIQKIGKELDSALKPTVFERMTGGLDKFGLSLGAVSAGALLAFGKGAINAADNIGDIAEKTGLSTNAVQQFQQAFEGAGISIDDIAKSASKLSMKIAKGDDSTEAAVQALGLSLDDLRNKSPEDTFKTVAIALSGVDDQGRKTALTTELLDRSMGAAAGAFNKANIEIMNNADLLGGDSVKAAGDFNDAQTRLTRSLQNALMSGIGPLLPALTTLADLAGMLAGVLGGVLKFSVDGLVLTFNVMRQAVADSLVSLIEMIQKLPFASKIPGAEKLGDAIGFLKEQSLSASNAIAAHMNPAMDKNAAGAETLSLRVGEYAGATKSATEASKELDPQIDRLTKSLTDQISAHEKLQQTVGKAAPTYDGFRIPVAKLVTDMPLLSSSLAETAKRTTEADAEALKWARTNGATLAPALKSTSESTKAITLEASNLSAAWSKAGATIVQALAGGGNAIKALGASLGSAFGEDIGKKVATNITGPLGQALGSAMGPLGAMAGSLLGAGFSKALGWVKGLFGGGDKTQNLLAAQAEAAKKAQEELNQQLEESKTKLEKLRGSLSGIQTELDGLIGKAYEMGYVFNQQGELTGFNFQKIAQVAKDFGVDLAALGPAFQQAQLTAEAQKVIDAFTLLTMSGADVGGVLVGMKDEINKIVNDSLKFRTVIPENMKPWIAELIRTGQLTDANGQKITDMSQIKFGEPVKSEYEKINSAIETVVKAMNDLLGQISSLVASIDRLTADRTMVVRAQYEDPGPPEGFGDPTRGRSGSGGGSEPEFATGTMGQFGRWFANFGTGTRAVLHGNEAVVRADQAAAFAADMGGGGNGAMAAEIAGLRADMNALLPRAIGRAVRDAMQLSGAMA